MIYSSCNFRSFFALLPPKKPQKSKFSKMKKIAGDIIILHCYIMCNKKTTLVPIDPKNQNFEKNEKNV